MEEEKYAELIISMSTDFLLKKIDFSHYANTLDMINNKVQKLSQNNTENEKV
jgi:hypothetical protein